MISNSYYVMPIEATDYCVGWNNYLYGIIEWGGGSVKVIYLEVIHVE